MKVTIIVAAAENGVIGYKNKMPWHLSSDLKFFKKTTLGHSIIMGRKTYESIGKPLPKRRNIVISRNQAYKVEGVEVVHSLEDALKLCKEEAEVFIIGGASIYQLARDLGIVNNILLTLVHCSPKGDTYFSLPEAKIWSKVSEQRHEQDQKNDFAHTFVNLKKMNSKETTQYKTGVLLINLGTPDTPKSSDVRKYLQEFLMDERVIDIPYIRRALLVNGIIAPFRAPASAKSYKEIWTEEGSPLLIYTREAAQLLQDRLGSDYWVEWAMRYGSPSIESALNKFKGKALKKLRIVTMYPHYASASTGSTLQKVMELVSRWPVIPQVEMISSYHDHPKLIDAFCAVGSAYEPNTYDHILFSYHGLPERQLIKSDCNNHCLKVDNCCQTLTDKNYYCYSAQCHDTTYKIAEKLGIPKEKYTICFQSRLGKTPWIQPFTSDVIEKLGKNGAKRVLVFCPAFTADCLETIFEIGVEYQEEFEEVGGEKLQLVEGLNTHPLWIDTLEDLVINV